MEKAGQFKFENMDLVINFIYKYKYFKMSNNVRDIENFADNQDSSIQTTKISAMHSNNEEELESSSLFKKL